MSSGSATEVPPNFITISSCSGGIPGRPRIATSAAGGETLCPMSGGARPAAVDA
jgi:hypothetical protein